MERALRFAFVVVITASSTQAIVAPRNGGPLPQAYYDVQARDGTAFRLSRAWVRSTERLRIERETFLYSRRGLGTTTAPRVLQVSGSYAIPVLMGRFSNVAQPYPHSDLQTQLFDGPWPTGTLSDYFDEVSYTAITLGGTVAGWFTVVQTDGYYEGTSNGLSPGDARTGEFLKELFDANDASIDFSQYDDDGPDGIPNSGDDDGFVDVVFVLHPESGGECDSTSTNMWSHTWLYKAWPVSGGQPYTTNDAATGGGFIKIDDYVIRPATACGDTTMIEIGSFAHAVGHAFGLPDLFDTDGGTNGIGDWGLMGTGNWNTPASPAHPSAWSRARCGWIVPTEIDWQGAVQAVPQIETTPTAYKLPFTDDRFCRSPGPCTIGGLFSLRCGIGGPEATTRGWVAAGGGGYGNLWNETIERKFTYDGTNPVTISYDYTYELEATYDSAFVEISIDGVETTLAAYTGMGSGTANIDVTTFLSPLGADTCYVIKFRVVSDVTGSDEDGGFFSTCGAFVVDNVSVTGGGESYANDFETSIDGWHQSRTDNPHSEYWLVANRQAVGFDANIHNAGLVVMHIDDEVMNSKLGNTGSGSDAAVRGVVVEEADGIGQLLMNPGNTGDGGDPFPGSTNNTTFSSGSSPATNTNANQSTLVEVSGISVSSPTMFAFMRAGDPPPSVANASPGAIDNDLVTVGLQVNGSDFQHGATFRLKLSGEADIIPSSVYWKDRGTLEGDINVYSKKGGMWNVEVTNADGQTFTLPNAVIINQIVAAQLVSALINVTVDGVELRFELFDKEDGETLTLHRAPGADGPWTLLPKGLEEVSENVYRFIDKSVLSGRTYYYLLSVISGDGSVRELYRGKAVIPSRELVLAQNYPNPFNPTTTIAFYLPTPGEVRVDIFDVSGARVKSLVSGFATAGPYERRWDGTNDAGEQVGSGVYIYRLQTGAVVLTRKMILLK